MRDRSAAAVAVGVDKTKPILLYAVQPAFSEPFVTKVTVGDWQKIDRLVPIDKSLGQMVRSAEYSS